MKINRLPSGNYHALAYSYTDTTGKRHYESFTAESKPEVMRMVAEFKATKERSADIDMTVAECIDRYITSKENILSPSTLLDYRHRQKLYYEEIGKIKLQKLRKEHLQAFVNDWAAKLSPKSVRNVYGLLNASIKMFSDKTYSITMPKKKPIERHLPTDENVVMFMNEASDNLKKSIALSSTGTLRRGEICGIKFKDIIRDKDTIYIHTDMVRGLNGWVHKEIPKTSSSVRYIQFPHEVIELLGTGEPEDYVVPITPDTITELFTRLRDKHGLKCRFHDFRAYAVSVLHAIGIPDVYLMQRGGWSNDATLKAVYRNVLNDKTDAFTSQANDYFANAFFGNKEECKTNAKREIKKP